MFAWLGEWWKRWEVRKREEAIQRHLGFLFRAHGGGISRISYEYNASQFSIEFGNVVLHYFVHMSQSGAFVSPVHSPALDFKGHDLGAVLRFLAKEKEWRPQIRGLAMLAEQLRPHAADLNENFSRTQYPAFREDTARYRPR
jgi:hypothetical protein